MFHMVSYQLKPDRVAENEQHTAPLYFIELGWRGDRVAQIRDFRLDLGHDRRRNAASSISIPAAPADQIRRVKVAHVTSRRE